MPANTTCFRYPAGGGNLDAERAVLRRMPASSTCFRYPPDAPPGVHQMPATACFRYPPGVPPAPPGVRQMPGSITCFRY